MNLFPERERIVPEFQNIGLFLYRELIVKHWRIIYRIDSTIVYVIAVLDCRRELETILLSRLTR